MKKSLFILLLLFQLTSVFAEEEYISADGYFLYFFSNDFTEYKYTTLDDYGSFSNITKIQKKNKMVFQFGLLEIKIMFFSNLMIILF